ncbi:adenine phosphoribosyltransferase [Synechocystis sp. PCC 6803]|jgi:adenine phosphoribosyltransferase|uniref:Adenine phosphoribosyltransferase n=1 Tax=Synechocystis sp. (strain ATCC 27184 / PCC 6803 / Kazusa) TaxID=1111708 RepID=APT_SYNY3|nr:MULTISPECIES: adenine phosphoribosyltransferase [unclassified Synechocystis]P73935.1 RecName: Full=Adenine phosphoribosyltransferase; Short=APRT [Synechocystis sp. PCC 6803 substr. Kazusa]BAM51757.1 adenine phosphoribosyltransferase [Synechocystis sp. PCC 6803] [Bacillus subtilis BEST7613]AGF51689.1 adenine phosphoribosyltransferase [Synechocystis sp. PCC 6803]ALJ67682.1 adenine phosphoribosyltransferase [Synechocystis sp. PCC 6803]AVP89515.1 adenine phosphoribosyltransferase [Synechocystis
MDLKALIRDIPDFPKPGIMFRDITTLLNSPEGLRYTIDSLVEQCESQELVPDHVVGMESRGFLFGMPLAYQMNAGFIPVRKPGKLPAPVHRVEYDLEYGKDSLEIHQDAVAPHHRVLIVDDLIATGGTAKATAELLTKLGCEVLGFAFIIELAALNGRQCLPDLPIISLVEY